MSQNFQSYLIRKSFLDKANLLYVGIGLQKLCVRYKGHLEAITKQRESLYRPTAENFCSFYNTELNTNIPFSDMFEPIPIGFESDTARRQRELDEARAKRQNANALARKWDEAKKEAAKKLRENELEELAKTIYKEKIKE